MGVYLMLSWHALLVDGSACTCTHKAVYMDGINLLAMVGRL